MKNIKNDQKKFFTQDNNLSNEKSALEKFKEFLNDRAHMPAQEFTRKHGAYMGFKPEQIAQMTGSFK